VGGELEVEDVEVVREAIESVSCRWCGHGRAVEVIEDEGIVGGDGPPAEQPG
jgi:hypothetical protein